MSVAVITKYDDGDIVVHQSDREGDPDVVVYENEENCQEDWNIYRMGFIKAVDGGYEITIEEEKGGGSLCYSFGVYPTLEEAEFLAAGWVNKWPDGWCQAHFDLYQAATNN